MTKLDKFLNFIFPIFASFIVLFFAPTWTGIDVGKIYYFAVGVSLLAFGGVCAAIYRQSIVVTHKKIFYFLGGFLIFLFISVFFARVPWIAFAGRALEFSTFVSMFCFVLFFGMGVYYFSYTKNVQNYIKSLFGFFSLVLIYQSVLLFLGSTVSLKTFTTKTSSILGTWHDIGIISSIVLFSILFILMYKKVGKLKKIALYILSFLSLCFIFLNNLKYLYVFTFCLMVWLLISAILRHKKYGVLLIIGLALVFGYIFQSNISNLLIKNNITYTEVKPSLGSTLTVLKNSTLKNPLLGIGPNHYGVAWSQYKPTFIVNNTVLWSTEFTVGYSSFLTIATNYGILFSLGLLLLIISYIIFIPRVIFHLSKKVNTHTDTFYLELFFINSVICIIFFLIQNINIVQLVILTTSIAIVFGQLHSLQILHFKKIELKKKYSKKIKVGIVAICIFAIIFSASITTFVAIKAYAYGLAEKATKAAQVGQNDRALILFSQAYNLDKNDIYARFVSQLYFKKLNQINATEITNENRQALQTYFKNTFSQTVQSAQIAYARNIFDMENLYNLVSIYRSVIPVVRDAYSNAVHVIDQGLLISPSDPTLFLARAQIELDNENISEATRYAEIAIQKKNNYSDAYMFLSRISSIKKDTVQTKQYLEKSINADPKNINALSEYASLLLNQKMYDSATSVLIQMLLIDPTLHQARFSLVLTLEQIGKFEDALTQAEMLKKYFPDNLDIANKIEQIKGEITNGIILDSAPSVEKIVDTKSTK